MSNITFFARTDYRGEGRKFGIRKEDRRYHAYIIGKTGMGKTTLLLNMILSDIMSGEGVGVVDPHGDLAETLLDYIPPQRINDVIYFSPSDIDYPISLNILEKTIPERRHIVVSGLLSVFRRLWKEFWGPRMEHIFRNAILALLEYPGNSTLLGIQRMLQDSDYRDRVVKKINDPVVKAFWEEEFRGYHQIPSEIAVRGTIANTEQGGSVPINAVGQKHCGSG